MKRYPSKHSYWWRRLEDVLKTSFVLVFRRRLDQDQYIHPSLTSPEDVFKTSSRPLGQYQYIRLGHMSSKRLQDVFKMSSGRLAKTSSRHFEDVFKTSSRHLAKNFSRRFQSVFKPSCKNVFNTSSRRPQDVLKTSSRRFQDISKTSCKDIFKTFSRRIIKLDCSC